MGARASVASAPDLRPRRLNKTMLDRQTILAIVQERSICR